MFTVEEHVHINRSPEQVYRYLTNPANFSIWIEDVKSIRAASQLALGTTFEETTVFRGEEKLSKGKVLELEPNRRLVLQVTSIVSGPKLMPTRTFILRETPQGTDLSWESRVQVGGMMRLFQPFLPKMFHEKTQAYLSTLKSILEAT